MSNSICISLTCPKHSFTAMCCWRPTRLEVTLRLFFFLYARGEKKDESRLNTSELNSASQIENKRQEFTNLQRKLLWHCTCRKRQNFCSKFPNFPCFYRQTRSPPNLLHECSFKQAGQAFKNTSSPAPITLSKKTKHKKKLHARNRRELQQRRKRTGDGKKRTDRKRKKKGGQALNRLLRNSLQIK